MKKLLFILPAFLLSIAVNAQGTQTEDEVYVGKGKTFGNYKGTGIIIPDYNKTAKKPITNPTTLTGIVISGGGAGVQDSLKDKSGGLYSFNLKKDDGTVVTVGTRDYDFTVPKQLIGKRISIEGLNAGTISIDRKRKTVQKDIQFAAIGLKIID